MFVCLPTLMLELVKMLKSGNSAIDISKLAYFDGCFEYESRKSFRVHITLTPAVTSYKICFSVFKEAETDCTTHNLSFLFLS